jgi:molybdopterin converting factor small subunit
MDESIDRTISVKILFFGAARDAAGSGGITIDAVAPASVNTIRDAVFSSFPGIASFASSLMISVNEEYATGGTVVNDLDVVAFMPPVSGG